jgi:hypothetical protein
LQDDKKRESRIGLITHCALRQHLQADPSTAPERFVVWLQQTTKAGLEEGTMGNHPADVARRRILEEFVATPVAAVLSGDKPIPHTIGVRCVKLDSPQKYHVVRVNGREEPFQHYMAHPVLRELHVGYRHVNGELDRSSPVVYCVNQVYRLLERTGGRNVEVDLPPQSPLNGRALGSREPLKQFLERWRNAFKEFCQQQGIVERFRLTQGCVIEKTDGTSLQLRNFDRSMPWMKSDSFHHILRVHRSPLRRLD